MAMGEVLKVVVFLSLIWEITGYNKLDLQAINLFNFCRPSAYPYSMH